MQMTLRKCVSWETGFDPQSVCLLKDKASALDILSKSQVTVSVCGGQDVLLTLAPWALSWKRRKVLMVKGPLPGVCRGGPDQFSLPPFSTPYTPAPPDSQLPGLCGIWGVWSLFDAPGLKVRL